MPLKIHRVRFMRAIDEPGMYRAVCNCGWVKQGELEELRVRADNHHLERPEPPLKRPGFVSGLPDKMKGEL